jgi:phosphoglycolate phosphatase
MFEDKDVLVFDLDGTLVHVDLDWVEIRRKLLEMFPVGKWKLEEITTTVITEKIAEKLGSKALKEAYSMIRDLERGAGIRPIKQSVELASRLGAEGKKLAIFSNNSHETIEEILENLGLREMFGMIVGREDVTRHKPHPEGLEKILTHFKADKSCAAFIGNEAKSDIAAGRAAGIDAFLIEDVLGN